MLSNLHGGDLYLAVAVVAMLSFFIGLAVNAIMKEDGFGPVGNAVIVTAGFFLSIHFANEYGIRFRDVQFASVVGIAGSMSILFLLTSIKLYLNRVFH